MPYVEGETLQNRIAREHQLPVDDAVRIATNVSEALDYAHRHGVIHRDIKPANILLQDGKPVISDFGIALAVGVAGGGRLTETGLSVGTPHYMSPEQATGDLSVGAATDIYALGCVLYEMCALVPPFRADDMQGLYKKVIKGKYPRIPEHFSQEMATVIKFMLQVSPSYRPTCDQILSLPIIESLIKKFFPDDAANSTQAQSDDNSHEALLKTIRLSKNIFSLTERLPKAKYRSPKAGELSGGVLLQGGPGSKSKETLQTIQTGGDMHKAKTAKKTGKGKF